MIESDEASYTAFVTLERETESGPVVCPFQPPNKEEVWWLFLIDPATNSILTAVKTQLQTKVGLTRFRARLSGGGKAEDGNECTEDEAKDAAATCQSFKLPFRVPPAGTYNLQLLCMSDHWLGCDRRVALKLKAGKLHKAEMERRMKAELEVQEEEAASEGEGGSEGGDGSDAGGSGGGAEMEDFEDDLTESGTDETVSDEEDDDDKKKR